MKLTAARAVLSLLLSVPAAIQEDGFTPLFNGKDLAGWVGVNCAPETWSVREGMIHSTGKPICELRTERMYENFVLELEYMHTVPKGNAGLFVWGDALTARGQPFVRAIEIQILDGQNTDNYTSHGDVFAIHGAKMTPDRPHPGGWMRSLPSERRARPAGEWNHYRVTAKNGTLKLAVNGKEVSGGYDIVPRKGYIHLESEGGVVDYRNIRIRELPSAGTLPPDHVAQPDEGYKTVYTGTDFRGWQYPKGHEGHWVSKDWTIAYDGKSEAPDKHLSTENAYGDLRLIVDWRWRGDRGDALPFSIGTAEWPESARAAIAKALAMPAGQGDWRRGLLVRRGNRISLSIDGVSVAQDVEITGLTGPQRILLRHDGRQMEFANVFVREGRAE